ncbi:MAG: Ig-like domain-containing protein [Dehalococcoidia bacterium]
MKRAMRPWQSKHLFLGLTYILLVSIIIMGLSGCGSGESAETPTPTRPPTEEGPTPTNAGPTTTPGDGQPTLSPTDFYSLAVSISPSDAGSVTRAGTDFAAGTEVALTAVPALGYAFNYWDGDASGANESTAITMDSDKSVTAYFTAVTVQSIVVYPGLASIAIGRAQQFTAMATYSDGSTAVITNIATWQSYNPSVATIRSGGLAMGVSSGTVIITASVDTVQGLATITVTAS